jgi:hypothetical protein
LSRAALPCWPGIVRLGRPLAAGLFAAALSTTAGHQAVGSTADEAQSLLERAVAHIQAVGPPRAFADITRPDGGFVRGELYVFCMTNDGVMVAHGGNPKLVGKNLLSVRDAEGTASTADIIHVGLTQGKGWVEYLWPNPATGRVQRKVTYVLRIDDRTVCASGYYKPISP